MAHVDATGKIPETEFIVEEGIARFSINRPAARNSLTLGAVDALRAAVSATEASGARALILTGAGRNFCSGIDLALVEAATTRGDLDEVLEAVLSGLHASIKELRALPAAVVAAVEGAAAGAGIGVAMTADLRVVGRSAFFVPAYLALGASPDGGVSYALARALGSPGALATLVLNRRIGADELRAAGLADEVTDDGGSLAAARRLAGRVGDIDPHALVATRRLVDLAPTQGLHQQLDAEAETIRHIWREGTFSEGASRFFRGRQRAVRP